MNLHLTRLGLYGLTGLLCAFPFCVLLALPVVDLGVFRQVETVAVAIHVLSAGVALCLLLVSVGEPRALAPARSLAVLAPACLGLVALAASPLVDSPERALVGSMEHGMGAAWFVELALVTLGALVVRREAPRRFAWVAASAGASAAACLALQTLSLPYSPVDFLVPYDFREYLGVSGLVAAAALIALGGRAPVLAGSGLAIACLALSGNRAAALAAVVAAAAVFALWVLPGSPARARAWSAAVAVAVAVAGLAAVAVTPRLWERAAEASSPARGTVQSAAPIDWASVQSRPYGTVWGRGISVDMVLGDLAADPVRALAGRGFGTFETVAIERKREAPGRRIVAPVPTAATTYWDGDQKAKFHSHNLLLEAMLGAGVGGGLAWLAYLAGIALSARPRAMPGALLLLSTLAVTGSFWFLVNSALPLLAIAVAALAPAAVRRATPPPKAGPAEAAGTAALAALFVGCALLGAAQSAASRTATFERYFVPLLVGPSQEGCTGFQAVLVPERQINVNLYRMFVRFVEEKGAGAPEELRKRETLAANMSCLMRRYAVEHADVEAMETSLNARYALFKAAGADAASILAPDFSGWAEDIERFLAKAPGRTDVLIPYIAWSEASGNGQGLTQAERLVPQLREGDPVRSVLMAALERSRGDAAAHARLIAKALDEGLANLTPLPVEMAAGVRAQATR